MCFECNFFDEDVKDAFLRIVDDDTYPFAIQKGNDLYIITDDETSYTRTLILKNAQGWKNELLENYSNFRITYNEADDRYSFSGQCDINPDKPEEFSVTFEIAQCQTQIFNAFDSLYFNNPWYIICEAAMSIKNKSEILKESLNKSEQDLMQLINEAAALYPYSEKTKEDLSFQRLKETANKFGFHNLTKHFEMIEHLDATDKKIHKHFQKLINTMCQSEYEPLWREIYDKLRETQKEYPHRADFLNTDNSIIETRQEIQKLMELKGYSGTYPDFYKKGVSGNVKLKENYGKSYYIGKNNPAEFFIHCTESYWLEEHFEISFICGTSFLKEGVKDIYSCTFEDKKNRFFNDVSYYVSLNDDKDETDNLETCVSVAVKTAECIKLNKSERSKYNYSAPLNIEGFFGLYVLFSGVLSLVIILMMIIICIAVTVLFGLWRDIPEMLGEMPWWQLYLLSFILIDGALLIGEIKERRFK